MKRRVEYFTLIVLAAILLLNTINSTWYFLGTAKVSIIQWIIFNACAPSSIMYLLGLVVYFQTNKKMWLSIAVVPMMFFGTMGLFVFPWQNTNDLLIQFSHIIMTLNIALALWISLKHKDYKGFAIGLLTSVLIGIPFIAFTQFYCREHAEEVMKILGI